MIAQRLLIIAGIFVIGFSSLFFFPAVKRPEPGVSMNLPRFIGEWVGEDQEVSQKERDWLGPGTTFSRKLYTNGRGDHIYVSIVLAGDDMNTSIHRPERCLPAQGYTILTSRPQEVPIGEENLTVTRLYNQRQLPLRDGRTLDEFSLDYYWFVGSNRTTHSHITRNLLDIKDRTLHGYNQPWAFVMVIARISEGLQPFGLNEEQTDKMIKDFMGELIPEIGSSEVRFL